MMDADRGLGASSFEAQGRVARPRAAGPCFGRGQAAKALYRKAFSRWGGGVRIRASAVRERGVEVAGDDDSAAELPEHGCAGLDEVPMTSEPLVFSGLLDESADRGPTRGHVAHLDRRGSGRGHRGWRWLNEGSQHASKQGMPAPSPK